MDDRRRRLTILILLGLILLNGESAAWASQQAGNAPSVSNASSAVHAARFERPPVIDRRMDDEAWTVAARIETFHQVQPGDNLAPSQPTTVPIGDDRRALYLAAVWPFRGRAVRCTLASQLLDLRSRAPGRVSRARRRHTRRRRIAHRDPSRLPALAPSARRITIHFAS